MNRDGYTGGAAAVGVCCCTGVSLRFKCLRFGPGCVCCWCCCSVYVKQSCSVSFPLPPARVPSLNKKKKSLVAVMFPLLFSALHVLVERLVDAVKVLLAGWLFGAVCLCCGCVPLCNDSLVCCSDNSS